MSVMDKDVRSGPAVYSRGNPALYDVAGCAAIFSGRVE